MHIEREVLIVVTGDGNHYPRSGLEDAMAFCDMKREQRQHACVCRVRLVSEVVYGEIPVDMPSPFLPDISEAQRKQRRL